MTGRSWVGRLLLAVVLGFGAAAPAAAAEPRPVTLASGPELGAYFPVGVAIRLLLQDTGAVPKGGFRVLPTQGSVENLRGLRDGTTDFAIVQADQALDALNGTGAFAGEGPLPDLRLVMALHEEALALVARGDSGIAGVADLAGKRLVQAPPGAGWRHLVQGIVDAADGPAAVTLVPAADDDTAAALCAGEADAAFFFIGHPSASLVAALSRCPSRLVPVDGPAVRRLAGDTPPLTLTTIPGGLYPAQDAAVPTLGVRALVVAGRTTPDAAVTVLLKTVHDELPMLRKLHPALATLTAGTLKPDAGGVPLHAAAARYFEAMGR